jgi:hypothetical protein
MYQSDETLLLRWAGIAGLVAALCWTIGDVLIVGHVADHARFPLLFQAYADRIDVRMADRVVGVPTSRLIAGALFAVFSVPLYLVGCWHLWRGLRGGRRRWTVPAIALLFTGFALSPLPHAAFYFVGAAYQAVLATPADAHPQLLALAGEFHRVLVTVYYPAVGCLALGLLVFSVAIARGGCAYPRWFALTANPVVLGLLLAAVQALPGKPLPSWLEAAGINVVWLLVFAQSLALTWRDGKRAA